MTDDFEGRDQALAGCTAKLVAAYLKRNHVPISALPDLIASMQASLTALGQGQQPEAADLTVTEAQIRKSITPDALISFIDGKPYKVLRRHLRMHGLDAHAYRIRYGLPPDYPVVASSYSARRADISRGIRSGKSPP